MSTSHRLALIVMQNVFSCLLSLGPHTKKSQMHKTPQMTLNVTGSNGQHICTVVVAMVVMLVME